MSHAPRLDPEVEQALADERTAQIRDALDFLARPASDFLAFPFTAADAMMGRLPPGSVGIICAFTGSGKSTLVNSAIARWVHAGKRVFHMPLETRPYEWRTRWACMELGIDAGDVFAGVAQAQPDWEEVSYRLRVEIRSQKLDAMKEQGLWVDPVRKVTARGLREAVEDAATWGADVVVVDHIDHVKGDEGGNPYAESRKVNECVHDVALEHQMRLVLTSQLNLDGTRADRLAKFLPPQVKDVYMGSHKLHIATWVVGAYRPIRDRDPLTEPKPPEGSREPDRYVEAIKAARAGITEPWTALKPHTMGLVSMKNRNQSKDRHEGQRCELGVEQGRVVDIAEKDRYVTTGYGARP